MTQGADAPRLRSILIMTESSIGLRSPLSMPRHPARVAHAARRVRRVFDVGVHRGARDGRVVSAICARPGPLPKDMPCQRHAPVRLLFFHR